MASGSPTTSPEPDLLGARFATLRAAGRRALIPYLTAGYPDRSATPGLLDRLADAGADVIELGVPFSDPLADGPTIQRASQCAIRGGATLAWTIETLAGFRARSDTPVVLFTYLNPVVHYGVERFIGDAVAAGAQGVLLTDLPLGADDALEGAIEASPLALIRLVAPTTPPERAREIARRAQGFLYYVSRTGVTGARGSLRASLAREVAALRDVATVPVVVGFGISKPEHAAEIGPHADGIVVGSALIEVLDRGGADAAASFLRGLRAALDG